MVQQQYTEREEENSQTSSSQEEEEISESDLLADEDLLTQNNFYNNNRNEEEETEEIEEAYEDEDDNTFENKESSPKLSSPLVVSGSSSEESIQIDEDDLENLRHDEEVLERSIEDDKEMTEQFLLNDKSIMDMDTIVHTPLLLINNDNFTTPNSASSVMMAMPFEEFDQELMIPQEESNPLCVSSTIEDNNDRSDVCTENDKCKIEEQATIAISGVPTVIERVKDLNETTVQTIEIENEKQNETLTEEDQMKVLVIEDDQVVKREFQTNSQQQEHKPEIIMSVNLDEDLDVEMINDFLMSEKGTDMCEQQSKENSPAGESISNQSMNDSWNTHHQDYESQQHNFIPQLRSTFNYVQGIPLEELLNNYDHRIEYSTLEGIIQGLKNIGIHTVNCLPLIPKKHIALLPGMNDKLYENLMDCAQSLDPSQSCGFSTASQFLNEFQTRRFKISTGCTSFDELIGGGIESSSVTELFSESGCGKTQVCFTLCVTAQMPITENGTAGKVLFVDTMGTFSPNRIKDIAENMANNDERVTTLILNNVLRERIYTSDQLFSNLNRMTTLLKNNKGKPFRLIIVDSAVNIFRGEYKGRDEINVRQQHLGKYLDSLNKLAEQFNIPILITNQVMDSFDNKSLYSPHKPWNSSPSIKPVGGHVMAHTIPTRIQLSREQKEEKRTARVFKSSTRPEGYCHFKINATGIVDYETFD